MMFRIVALFLMMVGICWGQTVNLSPGQSATVNCSGDHINVNQTSAIQVIADCVPVTPPPPHTGLIVDHTSIALFDQIPSDVLATARTKRVMMRTASVGQNISQGLDCLVNNTLNSCRTGFTVPASQIPVVSQPQYSRVNWLFEFRGNPGWYGKTKDFVDQFNLRAGSFDVVSWKQSYVDDSTIYRFWDDTTTYTDIYNIETAELAHPQQTVVYWTAAISKLPLTYIHDFNQQMRVYAAMEGKPLMDLADIESHRLDGSECLTDGVPTICQEYCVETAGGHLTNGMAVQRVAKAWWVMMARLSGWSPQP